MISKAKYDAAVREANGQLSNKLRRYEVRVHGETHWLSAVLISKRSLRILLAAAKKAEAT